VKILHTADIHLKHYGDERWNTLLSVLAIAREQKTDAVVVSGDLFDKDLDAENLRPKIREIFSNNGIPILIIPGNHDAQLLGDMYFGSDAILLNDISHPHIIEDTAFYGLPFESLDENGVLERIHLLKQSLSGEYCNVLLFHGELLDIMFNQSDLGGEEETGYMPVRLSFFTDIRIDYVLAGHFHTNFDIRQLPEGGYFVYPGSPVSITRREIGRRKVNLFTTGEPPAEFPIDSPHYEKIIHTLDPLDTADPVGIIQEKIKSVHPQAKIILTVDGYFNKDKVGKSEKELAEQLNNLSQTHDIELAIQFRDIQHILEDDLFSSFISKLDTYNLDAAKRKRIREHAIQAMIEAKQ